MSISFLLVTIEDKMTTAITFSALIAIMFIGIGLQKKREGCNKKRISVKYGKLWVGAEVFLFVLVGATVNIGYLGKVGIKAVLFDCRHWCSGCWVYLYVSAWNQSSRRKKSLCDDGVYTKATVQAAIRRNSAFVGICLWGYGTYGGSTFNRADSATWKRL